MEPKKLKFGDTESIKYARNRERTLEINKLQKNLRNKVRCPLCGWRLERIVRTDMSAQEIEWRACQNDQCQQGAIFTDYEGNIL